MPDLDRELATLRDTLDGSVRQPELDSVVARHRQRTTRRRTQLAAAAAVLVVAAAIPLLRVQPEPEPSEAMPAGPGVTGGTPEIGDVEFADERTGYALRKTCDITKCDTDLMVTEDARHWYPRDLPDIDQTDGGYNVRLYVFAPHQVAVTVRSATSTRRWYSDDGGQTWHQVPDELAPKVESIPDGAILRSRCIGDTCRHIAGVEVMLPDSAQSAMLAIQPPLDDPRPGEIPAGDGAWWVFGKDRATGRAALAVSRDAGRTWMVSVIDEPGLSLVAAIHVTASHDTMYAMVVGQLDGGTIGLLTIFASTDGGRTWSRTWQAAADKEPRISNGVAIAEANGGLTVVADEAKVYHSADYGRTFELTEAHLDTVRWSRIGYLVKQIGSDNVYHRFADNPTWTEITVG